MRNCLCLLRKLVYISVLAGGVSVYAQWNQWAHDPQHNGYVPDVEGQPVNNIRWALEYDHSTPGGSIFIHYASPLIDGSNNIYMTERERIDGVVHYGVMKLDATGAVLCRYASDYAVPPFPFSRWEPVFHPVLTNGLLYVPRGRGALQGISPDDCSEIGDPIAPYPIPDDPDLLRQLLMTVFVAGVPTADASGNVFYPLLALSGNPLNLKSQFVRVDASGPVTSVNYEDLTGDPAQRPPMNAGAAIAPDGTIYIGSVRQGDPSTGWLVAVNPDLTLKWKGSMASDLSRVARLIDESSSCPVVGPDGRVFYGGHNGNQLSDGYLYSFSPNGDFLGSFDFGWDTTPAVFPDPDGDPTHYHLVQKYNRYLDRRYYMVSLDPNTMSIECQWELVGREWCINAPAIDKNGTVYTNGEDGFLYALQGMYPASNGGCSPTATRIMLDRARDAAYTPLALGPDGTVYTLNNGRMFSVGNPE